MHSTALLPYRAWQIGVPLLAAAIGVLAGVSPAMGVAAAAAIVYVVIVVQSLTVGLLIFLGIVFLESIGNLGALSLAKASGGLLFLAWIGLAATGQARRSQLMQDRPGLTVLLVLLGTWVAVSCLWAEDASVAADSALRWILNLVLFPIVYVAVTEGRHVRWMFGIFICGALVSAGIGIATGVSASGEDRLGGSGVNANELGELLIIAVVMAASLGLSRGMNAAGRVLAFAGSGLAVAALLGTVSRGALVGLLLAFLLAPLLAGPRRRLGALTLIVGGVLMGAIYLFGFAPAENVERITTPDATGTGRTDIWTVGTRMVEANPVQGVGAGNYATSAVHYLLRPGVLQRSDFIVDDPKPAHNIYLQVIAELGVVGLVLFLAVLGYALRSLLEAARIFRRNGDSPMEVLSRGLLIGLCGFLGAMTFSTAIYSKQLWLLLGACVAISALARSTERAAQRLLPAAAATSDPRTSMRGELRARR